MNGCITDMGNGGPVSYEQEEDVTLADRHAPRRVGPLRVYTEEAAKLRG